MAKKSKRSGNKPKKPVPKKKSMSKPQRQPRAGPPVASDFGPVSTINTAPVAIGNSLRGAETQVLHTPNGVRVVGRDYAFAVLGNGTATNFTLGGGMPLTPACLPTTILRNFTNMYNKFKINKIIFHFITASPTSQTGDIIFYYQKNTNSPQVNWTSGTFLPYVLSDSNTVIGPQWTNHSILVTPKTTWLDTDYGMCQDLEMQSAGDLFIFTKSSSSSSTGYVILDYDISFNTLSMTPRLGVIPTADALWNPASLAFTLITSGGTGTNILPNATSGTAFIGGTTITAAAFVAGRIYKIVLDSTNSTYTTPNAANLIFKQGTGGSALGGATSITNATDVVETAVPLADGYTFYGAAVTTTALCFFSTYEAAVTGYDGWTAAAATGTTYAVTLTCYYKFVGYQGGVNMQYTTQANT